MNIKLRYLLIGSGILFVIGLAVGNFTTPTKTVEKIETVEVEKIIEVEKKVYIEKENKKIYTKQQIHIIEKITPDGTYFKETFILNEGNVVVEKNIMVEVDKEIIQEKEKTIKELKEQLFDKNNWRVSALAAINWDKFDGKDITDSVVYGGIVEKRVLGPVYVGMMGTTSKEIGITLGLQF